LTQVYLVYCCIENSREIDWLVNSLKKYIFLAMVYAGIVYIVFGKNEFAYSMDFSYKSFLPAALSFLLFSRKKKKLYLGIFVPCDKFQSGFKRNFCMLCFPYYI
jgi:hypothetical protein